MPASLCSLFLIGALLPGCSAPKPVAVGYVEGEYVHLAPLEVARIETLGVRRGEAVKAGQVIATVEATDATLAVKEAEARLAQAKAQLENLRRPRRPEEIAAIEANLTAAQAQAEDARRTLARRQDLAARGIASKADLDATRTAADVAQARIGEIRANLATAKLGAREDEIHAAERQVDQAQAGLEVARWRLERRSVRAQADGRIHDLIRLAGEVAGPSAPIVSMLPEGAFKLKVYLPEKTLSRARVGRDLKVQCDGCPPGLLARISYIAPEPEFTPPVIYSLETRQKLVYLIEARPMGEGLARLQPGQIVDVTFAEAAP